MNRRNFLATASAGGAAVMLASCATTMPAKNYDRILGANDRIRIGIIGVGSRGRDAHMEGVHRHDKEQNIEIIAVADPYRAHREQAAAMIKSWYNLEAKQFSSYRDLLALQELDAVMIASCDFQHTTHLQASAEAGKDIYIEKPLAMDMDRLLKAYDAVKASNAVVQVGTQLRSLPSFTGCKELVKTGIFGTINRIEQVRNTEQPYWYSYVKEVKEEDVDWNEFLLHLPYRPFDQWHYSGWYGYADYSDGPLPGYGSHFIDLVHYITGAQFPDSCVCLGGRYTWIDEYDFTCPDQIQALWHYPEGFLVSYCSNLGNGYGNSFKLYSDVGVLKMDKWTEPVYTAEGGSKNKGTIRGENKVEDIEMPDHFLDWLLCLRNRKTPNASIDAGFQHAVACLMGMQAYRSGRKTIYDRNKRNISYS
ncbi:Gfo/Idh/MocA family oxidoreductase [candidate division KSB1 bacterium]|nr:Gfo/Idh/MocA family oxidoreductase [candidate division KSB1 bacterium]